MNSNLREISCFQLRQLATVVFLFGWLGFRAEAASTPSVLRPSEVEKIVERLPGHEKFVCSGLSFFNGKLYAKSGAGLLEIETGTVWKVYQWSKFDSVVEGLSVNSAEGRLWIGLATFDGKDWRSVSMPKPKHGYFTRGDVLEGFRCVSSTSNFWLTGAGRAWSWDSDRRKWIEQMELPALKKGTRSGAMRRLSLLGDKQFIVVRYEYGWVIYGRDRFKTRAHGDTILKNLIGDGVLYFDKSWLEISNVTAEPFFVEQTVSTGAKGFMRTIDGDIFQVTTSSVSKLESPGFCETLTVTTEGTLLASFRDLGVYEFAGDWKFRFKAPYPSTEGEHRVYLAESGGQIALATTSPGGLWVFNGTELKQIEFPTSSKKN